MATRNSAAAKADSNFFDESDDSAALVPLAPTINAPAPVFSDDNAFDNAELAMPFIKLAQALTKEVGDDQAKAGQWIVSGIGAFDTLTIVPLGRANTRERRIGTGNAAVTVCKSPDAKTGYGDPGGDCARCAFAQWTPGDGGTNRPPQCTLQNNFAVFLPDHDTMAVVRFQKTSAAAAKVINSQAMARGFRNFAVTLSSVKDKNAKGNFAKPVITVADVDDSVYAAARRMMPSAAATAATYANAEGGDDSIPF